MRRTLFGDELTELCSVDFVVTVEDVLDAVAQALDRLLFDVRSKGFVDFGVAAQGSFVRKSDSKFAGFFGLVGCEPGVEHADDLILGGSDGVDHIDTYNRIRQAINSAVQKMINTSTRKEGGA